MKLILLICFCLSQAAFALTEIKGQVSVEQKCHKDELVVWLSEPPKNKERPTLLTHTMVPNNGTFQFFTNPGTYHVALSSQSGCFWEKTVTVKKDEQLSLNILGTKK